MWSQQVWDLYEQQFGRVSFDGAGSTVTVTVHYGQDYDNAFWDGEQLVFGDGDGEIFERFTKPADVLAHEFSHGVVQYTSAFTYNGQSGALNESIADVFAAMSIQHAAGQTADQASWLIGEGLFKPDVQRHRAALDARARDRVRRPAPRQGPAGRVDGRLRRHHRGQRRGAPELGHPQPGVRPGREQRRRSQLGADRQGLVRRTHLLDGGRLDRLPRSSRTRPSRPPPSCSPARPCPIRCARLGWRSGCSTARCPSTWSSRHRLRLRRHRARVALRGKLGRCRTCSTSGSADPRAGGDAREGGGATQRRLHRAGAQRPDRARHRSAGRGGASAAATGRPAAGDAPARACPTGSSTRSRSVSSRSRSESATSRLTCSGSSRSCSDRAAQTSPGSTTDLG